MIYVFRESGWCLSLLSSDPLNAVPIGQQPSLEIVLRGMRVEIVILPNPLAHLALGLICIGEIVRSGVHVGKSHHGIGGIIAIPQKVLNGSLQLLLFVGLFQSCLRR